MKRQIKRQWKEKMYVLTTEEKILRVSKHNKRSTGQNQILREKTKPISSSSLLRSRE